MTRKLLTVEKLKELYDIDMWSKETIEQFRTVLLDWYDKEKRDLPWRRTSDPYKIWISEIMLQQTRVDTVIPYYNRFLEVFPKITDLADAQEDTLLKVWEGLGYYSRVRNMKAAAIQVTTDYDGQFPTEFEEIKKLKGIGPYTAGAISSIAFNHAEPAVDGNLMRVLSRLFEIDVDIAKPASRKVFEEVMYHIIDPDRPGDFNQALMDLGATICTPKNYDPAKSPVKAFNASYLNETYMQYPYKSKKKKSKIVNYFALLVKNQSGEYLLEKRSEDKLLANMWTFPMIEEQVILDYSGWKSFVQKDLHEIDEVEATAISKIMNDKYGLKLVVNRETSGAVKHVFTHLHWNIYLYEAKFDQSSENIPTNCEWVPENQFDLYAFPVLQQKLLKAHKEITLF